MKNYAPLLWILLLVLAVIQAYLGTLDGTKLTKAETPHLMFLYEARYWIVPTIAAFIIIIDGISKYRTPSKIKHQFRQDILKMMRSKVFQNSRDVRISIFKDAWWIRVIFIYFKANISHPFVWYKGQSKYTYPRTGEYIRVTERVGTEHAKSQTYFWISATTWRECEGIAAVARHENGEKQVHNLPDINHIDLSILDRLNGSADARLVNQYMEKGYIKDFKALQRIHIKARHLYAHVLLDKDANTVAVLVMDSSGEVSPFTEEAKQRISGYIELFTSTFV